MQFLLGIRLHLFPQQLHCQVLETRKFVTIGPLLPVELDDSMLDAKIPLGFTAWNFRLLGLGSQVFTSRGDLPPTIL